MPGFAYFFVLLVACEQASSPTSPPPASVATTGSPTTTLAPVPIETFELAHYFPEALVYDVRLSRRLTLETAAGGEGPLTEMPGAADVMITVEGVFPFGVSDGPEAGTYRLMTDAEPEAMTVEGTMEGEAIEDPVAIEELGAVPSMPAEMVVDPQGVILGDGSTLELFASPTIGFLGPVWPPDEVPMGEEWSFDHPGRVFGALEVERRIRGRITGREAGEAAVTVEGRSEAEPGEVDLGDFYRDFLATFDRPGGELVVSFDAISDRWTALFDPQEGRLMRSAADGTVRATVHGSSPGRAGGDPLPFELRLGIEDHIEAVLVPGS